MSRRGTTDEERKLFEQTFREGRPIRAALVKAAPKRKSASPGASGVNGATQERMRRGLLEPDARIDLHGMTQQAAHRTLFTWLAAAHSRGYRLVLVITGKGKRREDTGPIPQRMGALRHQVPHWLHLPPLGPAVLQVSEAHLKHGGGGAYYVYLRRR